MCIDQARGFSIIACISQDARKDKHMITNRKSQSTPSQEESFVQSSRLAGFRYGPRFEFLFDVPRVRLSMTAVAQCYYFHR
jgi:hypothetical protein